MGSEGFQTRILYPVCPGTVQAESCGNNRINPHRRQWPLVPTGTLLSVGCSGRGRKHDFFLGGGGTPALPSLKPLAQSTGNTFSISSLPGTRLTEWNSQPVCFPLTSKPTGQQTSLWGGDPGHTQGNPLACR